LQIRIRDPSWIRDEHPRSFFRERRNSTPVRTEEDERESEEEEEEEMETERAHAGRENNKRRIKGDEGGPPQKR
jgi:hypothetical protein